MQTLLVFLSVALTISILVRYGYWFSVPRGAYEIALILCTAAILAVAYGDSDHRLDIGVAAFVYFGLFIYGVCCRATDQSPRPTFYALINMAGAVASARVGAGTALTPIYASLIIGVLYTKV